MKTYYVYILKCFDDTYYTGITNDLNRRLTKHQDGYNHQSYTHKCRPVELVFFETFGDPNNAISFEERVKDRSRKKKEALIEQNWERLKKYAECKNESSHKNFEK